MTKRNVCLFSSKTGESRLPGASSGDGTLGFLLTWPSTGLDVGRGRLVVVVLVGSIELGRRKMKKFLEQSNFGREHVEVARFKIEEFTRRKKCKRGKLVRGGRGVAATGIFGITILV